MAESKRTEEQRTTRGAAGGQGSEALLQRGEAGAERQPTYGVLPRSLDDVAAEVEAGKREVGGAGGHQLQVKKDQLTWQHGLRHIANAHGAELTERARELVRRALGELYQEAQGAEPASKLAHEVADSIGDTETLNQLGEEQHNVEHRRLNQRGQALHG